MRVTEPLGELLHSEDGGSTYTFRSPPGSCYTSPAHCPPPRLPLTIKYEDDAIIVVEKPAMLPTENTRHIKDSVRARLEAILTSRGDHADQLRVPHRLDWETSGLLVVARTAEAMRSLAKQFAAHEVDKVYIADVLGLGPPHASGTITLPLAADLERLPRQKVDFVNGKSGQSLTTHFPHMSDPMFPTNHRMFSLSMANQQLLIGRRRRRFWCIVVMGRRLNIPQRLNIPRSHLITMWNL